MRRLVPPPIRYFKLAELFAEAETPRSVSLRNAFFVTRPGASKVVWDELSTSEMPKLVGAVADFEWNAELMLLVGAHDVLFPEGPCWRAELGELMQADAEVLGVAFAAADCARLLLPADVDWAMATDALEARVKA
jgi:hypothetical protein